MKARQRTEILIETRETTVIRFGTRQDSGDERTPNSPIEPAASASENFGTDAVISGRDRDADPLMGG
jgi:hypothetical protein